MTAITDYLLLIATLNQLLVFDKNDKNAEAIWMEPLKKNVFVFPW